MQTDINTDLICHLSIIYQFLVDKTLVTAESAATATKLVERFLEKKKEKRGRCLEPGEFPPQVAVGT